MKKVLLAIVALIAIATTVSAQTDKKRIIANFAAKFVVVDKKYAVMNYPVTQYDYLCITRKPNQGNKNINAVKVLTPNEQQNFARQITAFDSKIKAHVASSAELQTALLKKFNIQSESGPYNTSTKGFYIAVDYASYQYMQKVRNEFLKSGKEGLIGTSDIEGDIFNIN